MTDSESAPDRAGGAVVRVGDSDSSDALNDTKALTGEHSSDGSSADESADSLLREVAGLPRDQGITEPDRSGQRIAHYDVERQLGQGGMGIVYVAEDVRLGRKVALKLLPQRSTASEERRRRFLREARSASAVHHPNVATLFDVGEVDGTFYLAMELVEGRPLRELLRDGKLELSQALGFAKQIARGLGRAHAANIIHRDVKPENIIIQSDGTAKILDFGLAKLSSDLEASATGDEDSSDELVSRAGRVLGTPAYMSPEQAAGKPVDARTDVFAVGVVLYEMLRAERPKRDRVPRIDESPAVSKLVETCLQPEPEARYANGAALSAALEQIEVANEKPRRWWPLALLFAAAGAGALALGSMTAPPIEPTRGSAAVTAQDARETMPSATVVATLASTSPEQSATAAQAPSSSVPVASSTPRHQDPRPKPPATVDPLSHQK